MKIVKEFILREIAGEAVLVPTGETSQEFNGLVTLSESGSFIWKNLEKAESLEEMLSLILDEYDIDEATAKADTIEFITTLINNGIVECTKEDRTW